MVLECPIIGFGVVFCHLGEFFDNLTNLLHIRKELFMATLKETDPLLYDLIGLRGSGRGFNPCESDYVSYLCKKGVFRQTAERAVFLASRHPVYRGMSPEEIIRRKL
jgi:hypothetical protein